MNAEKPITQNVEAAEPRAVRAAIPVWVIVLVFLLLYFGMLYFDQAGGWFDKEVYPPYTSKEELVKYQPVTTRNPFDEGYKVYHKPTCVACHQADGKGTPGQFPPLVKSEWVQEQEPGRLIRIVLNGLTGEMNVQGQVYNGTMVPWKESLTDEEIADVLTYVRQNKDWGNNAPEVKPERVAEVRKKIEGDNLPFTEERLQKTSPAD